MRSRDARCAASFALIDGSNHCSSSAPERITVPRRHIEIGGDLVVIELGEELHEVVRDRPPRRMRADDLGLHAVVAHHFVGGETPVVEPMATGALPSRWRPADRSRRSCGTPCSRTPCPTPRSARRSCRIAASAIRENAATRPADTLTTVLWQPNSLSVCQNATAGCLP